MIDDGEAYEDSDAFLSLESLMSESPAGENHGRQATDRMPTTSDSHDGEKWGASHNSLDTTRRAATQWAQAEGATVWNRDELYWTGGKGFLPGERDWIIRPEEWAGLDTESLRAEALELLGVTPEEYALLDRPGRNSPAASEIQARLDERILQVKESGGRMIALARVLGWAVRGDDCKRMRKVIKRARKARQRQIEEEAA